MSRRSRKYRIASGELLVPVLSAASRNRMDVLFNASSTSVNSRPFAAPDDAVLVVRACLPVGVTLALETGRLPPGPMPTGTACEGQICAPYNATLQDVCLLNVCCVAQNISSCGNVIALPPLPGYMRLVLAPLSAVGTVNVYVEAISYKAASLLPKSHWLGGCVIDVVGPAGSAGTTGVAGATGATGPAGSAANATPCAIGVSIPMGTITQYAVGLDVNGCLVKQALQTIELRDCSNVLLYTFRAVQ